jgi:acetolactate synthase I/II/III large subunit
MNVADYIVMKLSGSGISRCFTIVGGHALFLNQAFHESKAIEVTYLHNEQATTMAADAYFRVSKKPAVVNVTSAPAALNALNGVYGAYVDSIPMLIISGQPKQSQTVGVTGLPLRQYGDQEFDRIVDVVMPICKHAVKLTAGSDLVYEITKALKFAISGKPGPVWLDVPMDIQGKTFSVPDQVEKSIHHILSLHINSRINEPSKHVYYLIKSKLEDAKRPVIYLGAQLKSYNTEVLVSQLIQILGIPVVTNWNAHDLIETENPLFCGRPGLRGERAGNFILHAADFLLCIGNRLAVRQVGTEKNIFSPESFKVMVENDVAELYKPNLSIDLPVFSEPSIFINKFLTILKDNNYRKSDQQEIWLIRAQETWQKYKPKYKDYAFKDNINPYHFLFMFFEKLEPNTNLVLGNGISVVGAFQTAIIKSGQLMFQNVGCASMGFDIPASIGAALASKKPVVCLTGDGSFQLNIQELQTVIGEDLNIVFVIINNGGYDSIRQSQRNVFGDNVEIHGVGPQSGVTFPSIDKIAVAYGFEYLSISRYESIQPILGKLFSKKKCICEVFVTEEQKYEPKVGLTRNSDGSITGGSLIDMLPKLSSKTINDVLKFLHEGK